MTSASGSVPAQACQPAVPITQTPSRPRLAPLSNAARARQASAMPATHRLMA